MINQRMERETGGQDALPWAPDRWRRHAAGLDFEVGLHVFESLFEGAQRFFAGLFGEDFKSAIENLFGSALLASYMRRFTKRAAKRLP